MTTQTQTRACVLCGNADDTYSQDRLWFCNDSKACQDRHEAYEKSRAYQNATPEKLKVLEAKRDRKKREWEQLVTQCRDMKAALGVDDTSFLTHMDILNEMYLEEC